MAISVAAVGATAHSSDASVNTTMPTENSRLRPSKVGDHPGWHQQRGEHDPVSIQNLRQLVDPGGGK
jgi:hypothetical protein